MEQSGEAFTLTLPEDEGLVRKIEAVLGARIERQKLPDFDYGNFTPNIQVSESRSESRRRAAHYRPGKSIHKHTPRRRKPNVRPDTNLARPHLYNTNNSIGSRRMRHPRQGSTVTAANPSL